MENNRYRIAELAQKAGVTKRTIHYYIGRGLLPSPDGAGLGTTYSDDHLYRVMLIKKLQDAYLPLDEIKKRMAGMKPDDVREKLGEHLKENPGKRAGAGGNNKNGIDAKSGTGAGARAEAEEGAAKGAAAGATPTAAAEAAGNRGVCSKSHVDEIRGVAYERLNVGFGLEIHFPGDNIKARKLADKLYQYAEKVLKEG